MTDAVRLWCMRHAESQANLTGLAAATPAALLTPHGHSQAAATAQLLAAEPITMVYCSTARRTRQTAEYLARVQPSCELTVMPELDEIDIGLPTGTDDDRVRQDVATVLRAWVVDRDLQRRVLNGENGHEVLRRVTTALETIATTHPGDTVAVVGHVASLTVGLANLCGLGPNVWGHPLLYVQPFVIDHHDGRWRCGAWPGLAL